MSKDRQMGDDDLRREFAQLPDPEPSAEVVERHRMQLQEEMNRANTTDEIAADEEAVEGRNVAGTKRSRSGERGWPRMAVAAGIVLLAASVALLATLWTTRDSRNEVATKSSAPASSAPQASLPNDGLKCGATPPRTVAIPAGFSSPTQRPVADAPNAMSSEQLVLTWTNGSTDIEFRWPADPDVAAEVPDAPPVSAPSAQMELVKPPNPQQTSTGRTRNYLAIRLPDQPLGCQAVQLSVFGPSADAVGTIVDTLESHPFEG